MNRFFLHGGRSNPLLRSESLVASLNNFTICFRSSLFPTKTAGNRFKIRRKFVVALAISNSPAKLTSMKKRSPELDLTTSMNS
ncbi:hypothetical protein Hanom_Chr01g00008571 [Helianthus anomalus]